VTWVSVNGGPDGGWKNADDKMRMKKCRWKNADGKMPISKNGNDNVRMVKSQGEE